MSAAVGGTAAGDRGSGRQRDSFEIAVLVALTGLAFAVLAGLLLRTLIKGGYVTGGDGFLVVDPLQYLNWIRQTSTHLAAANLYDFGQLRFTFVHPGLLAGALVYKLTGGLIFSYAVFKPLAVMALFCGVAGMCHRHLSQRADRRFALVAALFFCAPSAALGGLILSGSSPTKIDLDFAAGEVWTGSYLWGYVFTAVAVGLVPLGLIAFERAQRAGSVKLLLAAAGCAFFSSWLQPWQGATFLAILVTTELILAIVARQTANAQVKRLVLVVLAGALPLVYYFVLSKTDPAWRLAGEANALSRWPLWVLAVTLLPIALPAAATYGRGNWGDRGAIALRLWPLCGLAIYFAPLGTFPFHALQGVQYPLVILATIAWRNHLGNRTLPFAGAVVIASLLVVPGTIYRVDQIRNAVSLGVQPFFLTDDEHAALDLLHSDPRSGGVITENYLATVIPAYTGRQTFFGAGSWTPDFRQRRDLAGALFAGKLSNAGARELLVRPGAGFILDTCRANRAFYKQIQPLARVIWQRGCVRILRINHLHSGTKQPSLPSVPAGYNQ